MIHTFELYAVIRYSTYETLIKSGLFTYNRRKQTYYYADYKLLNKNGFCKFFIKKTNFNFKQCFMKIIVNPSKLIKSETGPLATFNPMKNKYDDIKYFFRIAFVEIMKKVQNYSAEAMDEIYFFSDIDNLNITRIDYCINIFLEDQNEVKQYLKLLSKGDIPHKHGAKFVKSAKGIKGCYYTNKSININFYNKLEQMLAHNKNTRSDENKYTKDEIDASKNILRLEVQCKSCLFNRKTFKKTYGDNRKLYFSEIIARDFIHKYLIEISQNGDYYKKSKVENAIERQRPVKFNSIQRKNGSKYKNMLSLFKKVSAPNCKGLWKYRQSLNKNERGKIDKTLKIFDSIGVNIITIPIRYKKDKLLNLWKIAYEQYFVDVE